MLNFYSKNSILMVVLEMHFFRESNLFVGMCSSVTFAPKSLVSADFPGKFYLSFLPLGSIIDESIRTLSAIPNVYSNTRIKSGETYVFLHKQQKRDARFSVFFLGTQSCCHQLVQELIIKLKSNTKNHIYPGKKFELSELGKRLCSHTLKITYYRKSDNWNCSFNQFLVEQNIFSWKKTFVKNISKWQLLALLLLSKFLCDHSCQRLPNPPIL